jgi:hypothetical protein
LVRQALSLVGLQYGLVWSSVGNSLVTCALARGQMVVQSGNNIFDQFILTLRWRLRLRYKLAHSRQICSVKLVVRHLALIWRLGLPGNCGIDCVSSDLGRCGGASLHEKHYTD